MTPIRHAEDLERLLAEAAAGLNAAAPRRHSLLSSFRFAGNGLRHLFRTQRNARIHLVAAVAATALAFWLGLSGTQLAILWLTLGVVLMAEAFNTALEAAVDLTTEEYHPLAGLAKDLSAGAVLLTAIGAVAVGGALFLPALIHRAGF